MREPKSPPFKQPGGWQFLIGVAVLLFVVPAVIVLFQYVF